MLTVVARHLDEDTLLGACKSIEIPEPGKVEFHTDRENLGGGVDAAILVSVIAGGAATVTAVINGLFLLLQQRIANKSASKEAPRGLVVKMTKKTIRIQHEAHLIRQEELEDDSVLEIRLE